MRIAVGIALIIGATMTITATAQPQADQQQVKAQKPFWQWAQTPPMGWNSWDCFGAGVNEQQTRENTDYMAEKLKQHGWQYIVVDIQWYEPQARTDRYRANAVLTIDEHARLMPAPNRFPSAEGGKGFKPLADYVHSKGLKFGIHLMRGIPRQAVRDNLPILGTNVRAADIANTASVCSWNTDMYGVDMSKPGAQEYYNSVFNLIASWDVDYVKVDDLSRPYFDNYAEIEAIRKAIDQTGRPMVLSTSPGETPLDSGPHVSNHANLWRISDDFWDTWPALKEQFTRCANWAKFSGPGHWPDADMLPLGAIRQWTENRNWTRFTKDEQITHMTLWAIFRSPLMMGGHMPKNDDFTLSLLTNDAVIAVNQKGTNARPLFRVGNKIAWASDAPEPGVKYLAVFNAEDKLASSPGNTEKVPVALKDLGITGSCTIDDLWSGKPVGTFSGEFAPELPYHGAGLYRVTPTR